METTSEDHPHRLDVAVVGAGPFGLSVAAHLAPSVRVRVFGQPMRTWRELLPPQTILRSTWEESSLSAPGAAGTTDAWARETGEARREPLPLDVFLSYADWFRERFVPDLDADDVLSVERDGDGFRVTTAAGRPAVADRLVVAVGVTPFGQVPPAFAKVGEGRVSLAGEERDFHRFRGRRVAVVGGGQGALEAALWAVRAGASVEVIVRSPIRWFADRETWTPRRRPAEWLYRLAYPVVGYGPPPLNRLAVRPAAFAALPRPLRRGLTRRVLRAGGSPWLRPELEAGARVTERRGVDRAEAGDGGVLLRLDDGTTRVVDHVLLGTGYRFSVERLAFLASDLRAEIRSDPEGFPVLTREFESSVPRLHLVGFAAEARFGPVSRFLLGTSYAAERVAGAVERANRSRAGPGSHGPQSPRSSPS